MAEESIAELVKQRSMLVILIAACTTARTAFEAADNAVDSELVADLSKMIQRSETELEKLADRIAGSGNLRSKYCTMAVESMITRCSSTSTGTVCMGLRRCSSGDSSGFSRGSRSSALQPLCASTKRTRRAKGEVAK